MAGEQRVGLWLKYLRILSGEGKVSVLRGERVG